MTTMQMTGEAALQPESANFPVLDHLFEIISRRGLEIDSRACEAGMEFRFLNEVNGVPNRGWLRIYFPAEGKCLLFFHKKSAVPFSRDRFSYGGVVIDARSAGRFDDRDVEEWIEFLLQGLPPRLRPKSLKKSLPYTVPEDQESTKGVHN
jgi:hypothetical protein